MGESPVNLCSYRLEKATKDLEGAQVLLDKNLYAQSLNRSYYSIFHSVRALLAFTKFDSKKHSGIIAYFNQNYIKTEIFSYEYFKIINNAERVRIQSDYNDFYVATKQQAEEQLENAKKILRGIKDFINQQYLTNS